VWSFIVQHLPGYLNQFKPRNACKQVFDDRQTDSLSCDAEVASKHHYFEDESKSKRQSQTLLEIKAVEYQTRNQMNSHYCFFCKTHQIKIISHWLREHKGEKEVIDILGASDRKSGLQCVHKLRSMGDRLYRWSAACDHDFNSTKSKRLQTVDSDVSDHMPEPISLQNSMSTAGGGQHGQLQKAGNDVGRHRSPSAAQGNSSKLSKKKSPERKRLQTVDSDDSVEMSEPMSIQNPMSTTCGGQHGQLQTAGDDVGRSRSVPSAAQGTSSRLSKKSTKRKRLQTVDSDDSWVCGPERHDVNKANSDDYYESSDDECIPAEEDDSATESYTSSCAEKDAVDKVAVSSRNHELSYFDKKPFCFYCGIPQTQLQRHWVTKHREERAVQEIIHATNKVEKRRSITKLRNTGNHLHNLEVLRQKKGEILVTYRSTRNKHADAYVPCEYCLGYYVGSELHRHKCKVRTDKSKGRVAMKASLLLPPPTGMSAKVQEVISGMNDGGIKLIAKTDLLLIDFAAKLIARKGVFKKKYIRDKVREVARFLIDMRKLDGFSRATLTDCIAPESFRQCVTAVKAVAGFDETTMQYKIPSLALKLGHSLGKLAKIVKRNAIEQSDSNAITKADHFADLCSMEWGDEIAHPALNTLNVRRRNKVKLQPLSTDVMKLNKYMNDTADRLANKLREASGHDVAETYRALAEITLAQVITFNRRRQGEVSNMTISDYERRTKVNMTADTMNALSELERSLCKLFVRVEIAGKRDRTVPILLSTRAQDSIDLLLQHRTAAGVRDSNCYLFALNLSDNNLRGCDAIKKAAESCGADNPDSLRATYLRKHVATVSQILNLQNNELDLLAQYMGHDIRVHRQFYRLPDDVLQTSKLAKLLLLMDSGKLCEQKGKSLDELLVDVDVDCSDVEPTGNNCVVNCELRISEMLRK
jgi:hypothetical protein